MLVSEAVLTALVAGIPLAPFVAFLILGAHLFLASSPRERVTSGLVLGALAISTSLVAIVSVLTLRSGRGMIELEGPAWFHAGEYRFALGFLLDELSLGLAATVAIISLLVGRFAVNYMHRERGHARFFMLLALSAFGLELVVLSSGYDQLIIGWECLGLSSIFLVMFFQDRPGPAKAGIRVLVTYRLADIGLLFGAVLLHVSAGSSEYESAFAHGEWPLGAAHVSTWTATVVALSFLLAAMGKSAQFPFGGWLPRAMEGPTPSSALFYGALSVHGGVFLLLRSMPLLAAAPVARAAVLAVGILTAVHATLVGRVQSDAKGQLAYATMAQVGLMFAEIGLNLPRVAVLHLVSHAFLRGFQLLRAPSALRDVERTRAVIEARGPHPEVARPAWWSRLAHIGYHTALERFFLDALLARLVVDPVLRLARALARSDARLVRAFGPGSDARAQVASSHDAEGRA